jgi:hypothetical protein
MKPANSDLVWQLCKRLRDADIPVVISLYETGFIKEIKIGKTLFHTKFANSSGKDFRHFFGFTVDDVELSRPYREAILVIGNDKIEKCYSVPYSQLAKYLRTGEPVWNPNQNYSAYKATIFPKRNYILKVEKGSGDSFVIENYRIDNVENYYRQFIPPKNAA